MAALFLRFKYQFKKLAKKILKNVLSLLPEATAEKIWTGLIGRYHLYRLYGLLAVFRSVFKSRQERQDIRNFESEMSALPKEKTCIIIESSMLWDAELFQRPQQLALAFSRLGCLVIYKQNYLAGSVQRFSPDLWVVDASHATGPEKAYRFLFSTYNYLPDLFRHRSESDFIVYEYIDHIDEKISGSSDVLIKLSANKKNMFANANIITASAQVLYEEAVSAAHGQVLLLPNGVDTDHYFSFSRKELPPKKMQHFCERYKGKIVGFFGAMAPWLDYALINQLIRQRKDLGFVFIGPDYGDSLHKLNQAENCLSLGFVDYFVLPDYALWFDICWIPFEAGDIAKATSPLKLFEYFAMGKPVVVASDMCECVRFEQVHKGSTPESYSAAFDLALEQALLPATATELKKLALENSWLARAQAFLDATSSMYNCNNQ